MWLFCTGTFTGPGNSHFAAEFPAASVGWDRSDAVLDRDRRQRIDSGVPAGAGTALRVEALARDRARGPIADIVTVVENLRAAYPHSRIVSVETPNDLRLDFRRDPGRPRGRIRVACGPRTARYSANFRGGAIGWTCSQELHESLLIHPAAGRIWNGVGAAFLLLLNVTGMVIWWPGIRNWRRALKVDFREELAADQLRPAQRSRASGPS